MNKVTREFEKRFAKYLGVKYALMVNSGSSANLLALFALINPKAKKRVKSQDECIIQPFVGQLLYGQLFKPD